MNLGHCRTNLTRSSGKYWVEVILHRLPSNSRLSVGVSTQDFPIATPLPGQSIVGNYAISTSIPQVGIGRSGRVFSRSTLQSGSAPLASAGTLMEGDAIGLALNLDEGTVGVYRQGNLVSNVPVPVGPSYNILLGVSKNCELEANLRQHTPFLFAAPSGYTDWDGNAPGFDGSQVISGFTHKVT